LNGINPQITPHSPSNWRVAMASCLGTFNSHISLHHVENPPSQLPKRWGGGSLEWRLGLAHFHNGYSFLMISPKLYDISLFFLLIFFSSLNTASFDTS
jgi:hypothetical protein